MILRMIMTMMMIFVKIRMARSVIRRMNEKRMMGLITMITVMMMVSMMTMRTIITMMTIMTINHLELSDK